MKQTFVPEAVPSEPIVSKYLICIAVLEFKNSEASLINLAESTSAFALINLD